MKIGLISDTHGNLSTIDRVVTLASDMDMWLHMGDCSPDAEYLQALVGIPVYGVAGNCDWSDASTSYEKIIEIEEHKIFITHGHNYDVRYTKKYLLEAAKNHKADIVVYGHTHIVENTLGDPIILNPGSASRPRDDTRGSFMIMELSKGLDPKINVIRLD